LEASRLEAEFSAHARSTAAQWDDPSYWTAQRRGHAKGPALLRLNLQESAFWSEQLYRAAGRRALARFVAFVATLGFVALMFLTLGGGEGGQTFARVAAVVLAALVSADELGVMLDSFGASRVACETVDRLANVNMEDLRSALAVFVDYSVATASAPPIPTGLYEREHDAIEELWAKASNRIDDADSTRT
jgi:hypothetical protein